MSFEIIHKPTFTNQLLIIPKEFIGQILQKIEFLRDDPSPDGKQKKKLHGFEGDVYRLRSGVYRIIYSYGDGWVALLGVDHRKDVYENDQLVADSATIDVHSLPNLENALDAKETQKFTTVQKSKSDDPLPAPITEELLNQLRVEKEHFGILLKCRTIDNLLNSDIPSEIIERVFDSLATPDFDKVLSQPSFVTGSTDNLLRFTEGELLGFLLKLDPEQEKYVTWAVDASGPTLLKGGPGTGKSTVALYRVKSLLETLKKKGTEKPHILFTTYTNALVTFSQQLLESLLGEDVKYVEVRTADSIARDVVSQHDGNFKIATAPDLKRLMIAAQGRAKNSLTGNTLQRQAQMQILNRLTIDYLIEEVNSVIEARGINSLDDYLETPRNGRLVPLNKTQRSAIWQLRNEFYELLKKEDLLTWQQIRTRALEILYNTNESFIYDAVVVDEAQDLDPNTLRLLVALCRQKNRLFVTADANQSIYGGAFRWTDVHDDLNFKGRTGILRINYRTTREITEAAYDYVNSGVLDDEPVARTYFHSGPMPVVRAVENVRDEADLLIRFCRTAAHEFRLALSACAILVPTEKAGTEIAGRLDFLGLDAEYMTGKSLDLNRSIVKILTLKSAKGLEFPIVAIAGFLDSQYPTIPRGTFDDAIQEIINRERRTMFVGMTRAMRALLIIAPSAKTSNLLQGFSPELWNLGSTE